MAIVGPRPHALQTRIEGPGITGWAQLNGLRGELDAMDKLLRRVDNDICHIDNWSIWLDIKIILKTAWLILVDKNAYSGIRRKTNSQGDTPITGTRRVQLWT